MYTTETSKVGQYKRGAKTSNQNDWKRIQVNLDSTKVKLLLSYKLFKNINNVTKERDGKSFPSSQNTQRERERERERGKHIQQQQRHGTSMPSVMFCV